MEQRQLNHNQHVRPEFATYVSPEDCTTLELVARQS